MKVFKFGGGIIKDPGSVRSIARVLQSFKHDDLVIVVSAMNKMTNAFESLVDAYFKGDGSTDDQLSAIMGYHSSLATGLFQAGHSVHEELQGLFESLRQYLSTPPSKDYDLEYDQVVSYGEVLSSVIIHHQLLSDGMENSWFDARQLIVTNADHRHATPDFTATRKKTRAALGPFLSERTGNERNIALTQGFIAGTLHNHVTTLGREGSDFSAAIFGWALDASEVIIWKDVPGVMSADPHVFDHTVKLETLSYREALELAYFGAKVIHPKTIRPLQNKNIPLKVRSFFDLDDPGTLIAHNVHSDAATPSVIIRRNQFLATIYPPDVSLLTPVQFSKIFRLLHKYGCQLNVLQNSASSFSICIDHPGRNKEALINSLQQAFRVRYNEELELLTIRNFDARAISDHTTGKEILMEERSRTTVQFVIRP